MKKLFIKNLFILTILVVSNTVYCQESYIIKGNSANVRLEPSLKAEILGKIHGGEVVSVTNVDNPEWFLISYYGNEGYVSSKLLIKLDDSDNYKDWKKVSTRTGDEHDCENIAPEYDYSIKNKLIIHAGYNEVVVVKLVNLYSDICIRVAFIKGGETYTIQNIPENNYYLKLAYGKDYRQNKQNGQCEIKFMVDAVYEKGKDILNYHRVKKPDTIEDGKLYGNWEEPSFELSLNVEFSKGSYHDFRSNKISEKEFNK